MLLILLILLYIRERFCATHHIIGDVLISYRHYTVNQFNAIVVNSSFWPIWASVGTVWSVWLSFYFIFFWSGCVYDSIMCLEELAMIHIFFYYGSFHT